MKDLKVVAVYTISNFGGIEIADIDDERVVWRWNFGTPEKWKVSNSHGGEWFQPTAGMMIEICECCCII